MKEIVDTMARESMADRPKRRAYSSELKAQVLQECGRRGASVAGVALSHTLNPNMVHRWIREERQRSVIAHAKAEPQQFIALELQDPAVVEAHEPPAARPAPEGTFQATTIQIEVRRGTATVCVRWPVEAAAACTAWLRDWLR
jgi:transposase